MSILYKFRAGKTFEALPLPGAAARLFDVKKAIVVAKKLDQAGIEFDLSVRDDTTGAEYTDESMLLPRGSRLVVHRLPAARGHGLLAKMARSQMGLGPAAGAAANAASAMGAAVPNNYYTIDTRGHDDHEEFVSTHAPALSMEDKELAALRAVTDVAASTTTAAAAAAAARGGRSANFRVAAAVAAAGGRGHAPRPARPNADPELRDQQAPAPKKRATGIPRTFLNLTAPASDARDGEGASAVPLLQPNAIGFEELVHRGGGQSESATGTKRNLDYALKLTATTIPDYLQCPLCRGVVRDAMILPWDAEGRTTCETCIRDALTQHGFRCPLTGHEGVSPDDLLPNMALRIAADKFIQEAMKQMEEIEKQQVEEDKPPEMADAVSGGSGNARSALLEGDGTDKGVILSKRATVAERRRKQEEEDPFGAGEDDDFGGDVFAVERAPTENKKNADSQDEKGVGMETENLQPQSSDMKDESHMDEAEGESEQPPENNKEEAMSGTSTEEQPPPASQTNVQNQWNVDTSATVPPPVDKSPTDAAAMGGTTSHHRTNAATATSRRRGPPAGYTMGPAGGAVPREVPAVRDTGVSASRGGGGRYGGGGRRYHGGGRGRSDWSARGYAGAPASSWHTRSNSGTQSMGNNNNDDETITTNRSRNNEDQMSDDGGGDPYRGSKRPRADDDQYMAAAAIESASGVGAPDDASSTSSLQYSNRDYNNNTNSQYYNGSGGRGGYRDYRGGGRGDSRGGGGYQRGGGRAGGGYYRGGGGGTWEDRGGGGAGAGGPRGGYRGGGRGGGYRGRGRY